MADAGDVIIPVPLSLRTWNPGGGIVDYLPYGDVTGLCRIPMGWDDPAYRGGVAMAAQGYYGQYVNNDARQQVVGGYDNINLLFHPPVGASADGLSDNRWVRQDRLMRVAPYSMYSGSSIYSAIWAQRHGKYLYHAYSAQRADGFFYPTMHIAKLSGNENIAWVDSGGYSTNDFYGVTSPYSVYHEGYDGYATDHEFPWVWFQNGSLIMRFRDDNRQLGYRYHIISNSGDYYVGRIWLNMQTYGDVSGKAILGIGTLAHPWNVSDYEPPELWWFVKTTVNGHLNGGVTIYRAQWKPGQFTRYTGINNWHGWQASNVDYYSEMMAQENPHAEAFEKSWYNDAHIVGTIEPSTWWAPEGTEAGVGTLKENPTTIKVFRHPSVRDALTLLFVIPSGAVVYHSRDNGKTWDRPVVCTPYTPYVDGGIVKSSTQSAIVLDDGKPVMPARYYGNMYSAHIEHSGALLAPEGVTKGMGYFDRTSVTHRRSDINRGAWV